MILKASQRGGAKQLGEHLLKTEENEHVEVHEIKGFMADNLIDALHETHAISTGTQCQKFLFSISLNPPQEENVSIEVFETAIESIEQKLGLDGQARVIVFHEKEGRRHAHVVWSRIDAEKMKAIKLPYFKLHLRDISRELYLEHDWKMPRGLVNSKDRDPLNFTHAEWQHAKRTKQDSRTLKSLFQDCWAISDSRKAFARALETKGYYLTRGDRRGFVAIDYQGEIYAVSRYTGKRAKDVRTKLGDPQDLPSVEDTKALIASRMTKLLEGYISESKALLNKSHAKIAFNKKRMTDTHQLERKCLYDSLQDRWNAETKNRTNRLSKGFKGIWDRITGTYAKIKRHNEVEALKAYHRDQQQKNTLIFNQLDERRILQKEITHLRNLYSKKLSHLHHDIAYYMKIGDEKLPSKNRAEPVYINDIDLEI